MFLQGSQIRRVHFIGVSGIGVSAAAKISIEEGLEVSGSADTENEQTGMLRGLGVDFFLGHRAENVCGAQAVVRSAAVDDGNPEVRAARSEGIPVLYYSEYIGMLMAPKKGIAVAGTHGKTTTTALLGSILAGAGTEPTIVCGGVMRNFGTNAVRGGGDYFVAEACEYHRSFHDLRKWYSVVTNIETDHLDYYRDLAEIRDAFRRFLETTDGRGASVVNGDDPNVLETIAGLRAQEILTVGTGPGNVYRIDDVRGSGGIYSCGVSRKGVRLLSLRLSVPGLFNCTNAALASVLAVRLGIERGIVERAVHSFSGTIRRLEHLGSVDGRNIFSDYAHHPTEIRVTLQALRERYPGSSVTVVFQPHQYSRTIELFDDFASVLAEADRLVVTEIYWQRDAERYVNKVGGEDLFRAVKERMERSGKGPEAFFVPEKEELPGFLHRLGGSGGVIVFLGAGDIDDAARRFARNGT